jgi:SAM-dependent methyltransferase
MARTTALPAHHPATAMSHSARTADGAALRRWKKEQAAAWGAGTTGYRHTLAAVHDELLHRLTPAAGQRWLDLATGTGDLAIRAAPLGAIVTAQDFAAPPVAIAKKRAAERHLRIEFDVHDAEQLSYPDASFDVVTSAHGVVFAADHAAVAGELARVCRPGARIGLTCWTPQPQLDRLKGRAWPAEPRPPGIGNPADWSRRDYVKRLLGADFDLVFVDAVSHWRARSGEQAWRQFITANGHAQRGVAALSSAERQALRSDWIDFFEAHRTASGVTVARPYLLILGTRVTVRVASGAILHGECR